MKKSTERHSYIKEKLAGLEFDFFWSIDGKKLDRNELEKEGLYHSHLTKLLKNEKDVLPGIYLLSVLAAHCLIILFTKIFWRKVIKEH